MYPSFSSSCRMIQALFRVNTTKVRCARIHTSIPQLNSSLSSHGGAAPGRPVLEWCEHPDKNYIVQTGNYKAKECRAYFNEIWLRGQLEKMSTIGEESTVKICSGQTLLTCWRGGGGNCWLRSSAGAFAPPPPQLTYKNRLDVLDIDVEIDVVDINYKYCRVNIARHVILIIQTETKHRSHQHCHSIDRKRVGYPRLHSWRTHTRMHVCLREIA